MNKYKIGCDELREVENSNDKALNVSNFDMKSSQVSSTVPYLTKEICISGVQTSGLKDLRDWL